MSRLIRVFPRRTKATPNDALAYFGPPDRFAAADEVHVDCTFTYDKPSAERLAKQWRVVAPTKLGGVAYGDPGAEFIPGRYIKLGYGFTSRGCPRRCWFCSVWKRDPVPRLLPVIDCWNILDDNLLACPRPHVEAVFAMLKRQGRQFEFTGGLEALSLQDYQVDLLASLHPRPSMFFAYDPGDAFETLEHAGRRLIEAGFSPRSHLLRCYVLIGYPKDTLALAAARLEQIRSASPRWRCCGGRRHRRRKNGPPMMSGGLFSGVGLGPPSFTHAKRPALQRISSWCARRSTPTAKTAARQDDQKTLTTNSAMSTVSARPEIAPPPSEDWNASAPTCSTASSLESLAPMPR
jgi:hypothetical protein